MAIRHELDEGRRRLHLTGDGGSGGRDVVAFTTEQLAARPELIEWDWIIDLSQATGEVRNEDVDEAARLFAGQDEPAWTVFVSADPNLPLWARVMDHQFSKRLHLTAPDADAAGRLLDRKRAG